MALKETQERVPMSRQTLVSRERVEQEQKQLAQECAAAVNHGNSQVFAADRRMHPTEQAVNELWGALSILSSQLDDLENNLRPYLSITDPGSTKPEVAEEVPQSEIHGALLEIYQDVRRKIVRVDYLAQSIR